MLTSEGPAADRLWWPETGAAFASGVPSAEQWHGERQSGWCGSNGSSASLDDIEGIEIGTTSREYRPDLPANLHDYHYRVIRRLVSTHCIGEPTRGQMQRAADRRHRAELLRKLTVLGGWSGWKARRRAQLRYRALRWFGRAATLPAASEEFLIGRVSGP